MLRLACIAPFGRGLLRSRFSAIAPALVPVRSFAVDLEDGTQLHTYHAAREEEASPSPPAQRLQYTRASYKLDSTIGFATSRGPRMKNEDRSCFDVVRDLEHSYLLRPSHNRATVISRSNPVYVFGVFDGHAGNRASQFLAKHLIPTLHTQAEEQRAKQSEAPSLEGHLEMALGKLEAQFQERAHGRNYPDGSTACVIAIDPNAHLAVIANIGDSRAVLCERGRAVALTKDHRPYHEDEKARIEEMGGSVVLGTDGTQRLMGLLESSRAIGNVSMKQFGCSAEPTMTELRIDDFHHSFILLATDGLFRVMSGQEAVDIVKETNDAQRGAETVVHKAIFEYGTPDDTTAMVIPLMGWGNYHSQLYTQLLRDVRVTDVFGLPILEIPKNLIPVLDRPDHTQSDVLLTLFSLLDTGADGRLCAEDIRMGLMLLGHELLEDEVELILSACCGDTPDSISFQEFASQYEAVPADVGLSALSGGTEMHVPAG